MTSIISELIVPPLSLYGQTGDRSLEYIGLTICRLRQTVSGRVYRKEEKGSSLRDRLAPPYPALLERFAAFAAEPGVCLCDVSDDRGGKQRTCRLVFRLPKRMERHREEELTAAFFAAADPEEVLGRQTGEHLRAYLDGGCTLYQLGGEFDESLRPVSVKYYLHFPEGEEDTAKLLLLSGQGRADDEAICANGYKRAFIGVNDSGARTEEKLYYITKALGFKTPYLTENMQNVIRALSLDPVLTDRVLQEILEKGLFMEGLALSLSSDSMIRTYFREFS